MMDRVVDKVLDRVDRMVDRVRCVREKEETTWMHNVDGCGQDGG